MSELEKQALIEQTVITTLRELGVISSLITRTEMIRIVGSQKRVDQALTEGELTPIRGDGRNSTIRVCRSQFNKWLAQLKESPIIY